MLYDSDAGQAEGQRQEAPTDWRVWVTSPTHLVVTVAGVVAGGLLLGYLIVVLFVFPPQNVAAGLKRVPDVVGRTAEEARRQVERAGLEYEEAMGIPHADAAGTVVAQEPLGGQVAPPGSSVRVSLSLGSQQRPVPDVVGLSYEQAEMVLERAGFETEVTRVDAGEDIGQVVGTRPSAGTPLELRGGVRMLVSAGLRKVPAPDLLMRSLPEAEATLERIGLRIGRVAEDSSGDAAPGTVIAQSPSPGTRVARGAGVSVTVAVRPPEVTVDASVAPPDSGAVPPDTGAVPPDTGAVPPDTGAVLPVSAAVATDSKRARASTTTSKESG